MSASDSGGTPEETDRATERTAGTDGNLIHGLADRVETVGDRWEDAKAGLAEREAPDLPGPDLSVSIPDAITRRMEERGETIEEEDPDLTPPRAVQKIDEVMTNFSDSLRDWEDRNLPRTEEAIDTDTGRLDTVTTGTRNVAADRAAPALDQVADVAERPLDYVASTGKSLVDGGVRMLGEDAATYQQAYTRGRENPEQPLFGASEADESEESEEEETTSVYREALKTVKQSQYVAGTSYTNRVGVLDELATASVAPVVLTGRAVGAVSKAREDYAERRDEARDGDAEKPESVLGMIARRQGEKFEEGRREALARDAEAGVAAKLGGATAVLREAYERGREDPEQPLYGEAEERDGTSVLGNSGETAELAERATDRDIGRLEAGVLTGATLAGRAVGAVSRVPEEYAKRRDATRNGEVDRSTPRGEDLTEAVVEDGLRSQLAGTATSLVRGGLRRGGRQFEESRLEALRDDTNSESTDVDRAESEAESESRQETENPSRRQRVARTASGVQDWVVGKLREGSDRLEAWGREASSDDDPETVTDVAPDTERSDAEDDPAGEDTGTDIRKARHTTEGETVYDESALDSKDAEPDVEEETTNDPMVVADGNDGQVTPDDDERTLR